VIGVLASRGTSIGFNIDEVAYVPVRTAMRMFDLGSLFRIMAEVGSNAEIPPARGKAIRLLQERHQGVEDVTVLTQDAVLATFNQILVILTAALAAIAAISLTVAGIGIMNVMLVSVSERTSEIGLLKSLGVTRRQIIGAFLAEAAIVSTAGGIVGLAAGIGAGRILERLVPDFPVHPPLWAALAGLLLSLSVGIVFGSLPARRAAGMDPVEALARGTRG
jgi:putative ABC transport system permease protein